ncbi:alpha-mannosidase [Halalkalibacter sp. APA_J-10(15)]|uniref:alpha-mannosidase n=1 Tax=Halalkalibacter sp. APA_J-10(15) TaxID=2933805 RepID=UPI001FF382E6|nr:alpha-mannosidase [Halalkalibacter sp. APA_J-10(15)]MCK0470156.1 alpha-mannosidase [Halalkalibacter sp. APA_J-10(15)]
MERIQRFLNEISKYVLVTSRELGDWKGTVGIYEQPGEYSWHTHNLTIRKGDRLISSGETMRLKQTVIAPSDSNKGELGLRLLFGSLAQRTIHEALVSVDGIPYHGIDRNRDYLPLPSTDKGQWEIEVELYNPIAQSKDRLNEQNEPAEYEPADLYLLENDLVIKNQPLEKYYYLLKAYVEAIELLPESDMDRMMTYKTIQRHLNEVEHTDRGKWIDVSWVEQQIVDLKTELEKLSLRNSGLIHLVGQSHIDLAWLWPAKEAVRKCSRTFSTMSSLLEQHSSFLYAQSQPQAFAYMKEYYPDIYERVQKHVKSGRFELVGGMWVEPDLNIPSGESLVRQLLYGLAFYENEFGIKPKIEWLPDTFGYCASLPQILKLADMDYFMTTKMNWNDTNPFPYDLFYWKGIDGTDVMAYLNHGVNEYTHPAELDDHWKSYKQKDVHSEQMLLYGHGDGGGGVTREMLSYADHSGQLPGLPQVKYSTAHQFFENIEKSQPSLPTWYGDMYLELHRGTYTTHAYNKKANRYAEVLYRDAEIWTTFAKWQGALIDQNAIEKGWKLLLFNQFHDIIPGTSIPEVYTQSKKDYQYIHKVGQQQRDQALNWMVGQVGADGEGKPYIVFNSLSWQRSETVYIAGDASLTTVMVKDHAGQVLPSSVREEEDGHYILSTFVPTIPAMGYTTIWLTEKTSTSDKENIGEFHNRWETRFYRVQWNDHGEMISLFDKEEQREVIADGLSANQFQLFHDRPLVWDAWDIDQEFESTPAECVDLTKIEIVETGQVEDIIQFNFKLSNSTIKQQVVFSHHHKRIDFRTWIDWNEEHKLLKVAFPVDIRASQATYEIPFGAIERSTSKNTSWEKAQFEVCGQRFADLSEGNYGVSLLNDCKYGYDIKDQTIRLSLLRAPKWPDPTADIGEHEFSYSLYPHKGSWQDAQTAQRGLEYNQPVILKEGNQGIGKLPEEYSFIQVETEDTFIETVKQAEDMGGVVVRLYEATGSKRRIALRLNNSFEEIVETNLLEKPIEPFRASDSKLEFHLKPYEIKTFRLK